jgi:hypothetical protein
VTAAEVMARELLDLTDRRQLPPCGHSGDQWLSESAEERAIACSCCSCCPLLNLCADLADEIKPSFGVWAGRDRTPRARTT